MATSTSTTSPAARSARDNERDPTPHARPDAGPGVPFDEAAARALKNNALQQKLRLYLMALRMGRAQLIPPGTPAEEIRQRGKMIRAEVIAHLDEYLEQFVTNAEARGIQVHLARTDADARRIVRDIARKSGARTVAKGKSMVSEEVHLREALEADGLQVTETDLGELLVQLADEPPSHLIAPAMHMNMKQMAKVLQVTSPDGEPLPEDAAVLMSASRKWLRRRFMEADLGITGANFGIAETGQFFIVTNEGNGRLSSTLPDVHVALMGIERLLPSLESMPTIIQLLSRSGTNQHITVYISLFGGPRTAEELHGPREQHLVLVDNGRSKLLGTEFAEALECIRCGMCQNACPMYERAGGHAYQSVYAGPIGKVVTPLYGHSPIEDQLPHASSLCGACKEVCPVDIDLPRMLIRLRTFRPHPGPLGKREKTTVGWGARVLSSPGLYKAASRAARLGQTFVADDGWIRKAPGPAANWTLNRDLPAFASQPFRERWRKRTRKSAASPVDQNKD